MSWYLYFLHDPDSLMLFPTVTLIRTDTGYCVEVDWLVWGVGLEVEHD